MRRHVAGPIAVFALGVVTLALPASAAWAEPASGGGGHEVVGAIPSVAQGVATGVTAIVVFAISAGFLSLVVGPKIVKALNEREAKIRSEIEAAESARQQARAALEQYNRALADARAEAQRTLEQAKVQQQAQLAEMRTRAEQELAGLKDKATREIDSAKKQALTEIYTQSTALATAIAGRILRREVSQRDHEQLVHEAMSELAGRGHN
ncbi:MAG: ATP synthase F0 subunit B [Planctomyces sp.]|nr:ATP synthase F0 subunit B [Planctomyces sp.]